MTRDILPLRVGSWKFVSSLFPRIRVYSCASMVKNFLPAFQRLSMGMLAVAWTAFTGGCVTGPATQTGAYSASKVGDRASVSFEEVIATVQLAGRDVPVNLHVGLSVIANPKVV